MSTFLELLPYFAIAISAAFVGRVTAPKGRDAFKEPPPPK